MKKTYSLILLLFILFQIQAQATEFMVQDVPRAAASVSSAGKSKIHKQQITTGPDKTYTMDQIVNWTGRGSKRAALIIQWNDGKQPDAMVWGYRWDGIATAEDMFLAIAKADPRLFLFIKLHDSTRNKLIVGIGYNINQENRFKLTLRGVDQIASEGIFSYVFLYIQDFEVDPDFDQWICNNPEDHWCTEFYSESQSEKVKWFFWIQYSITQSIYTGYQTLYDKELQDGIWSGYWYGKTKVWDNIINKDVLNQFTAAPLPDYTKCVFFLNENCVGQDNGTLNFLDRYGEFTYDIYRKKNDKGSTFGIKSVFGTIFDGKLFVLSKENKRVVVANAITLEPLATIDAIKSPSKREADGRAFVGITPELGYISTSNGICTFNLKTYQIGEYVPGTDGETGNMILAGNYVFAVQRNRVLILKNNAVVYTISGCNYSSVCQSKDGMVWIAAGAVLIKVDPVTLEQERIMLYPHAKIGNSWDDWNAGSFCASTQKNALYWTNSDFFAPGNDVYCYEIGDGLSLMSPIYSLPKGQIFYGAGIRVHPVTNLLYITSTRNVFFNYNKNWVHVVDAATGKTVKDYELNAYNWFPAMPIFPETTPTNTQLAAVISNKISSTANHADVKHQQAYRSGDRLFNLPAGAVIEAYNMSGALCFKMKANHTELKIPKKGFLIFNVITEDGIQVIR